MPDTTVELRCAHKLRLGSSSSCDFVIQAELDLETNRVSPHLRDELMAHYYNTGVHMGYDGNGVEVRNLRHHNFRVYLVEEERLKGNVRVHLDRRKDPKGTAHFDNYGLKFQY